VKAGGVDGILPQEFCKHMKNTLLLPVLLLVVLFALPLSRARAQSADASDNLFKTIQALDNAIV
jgi:hypothetical protein